MNKLNKSVRRRRSRSLVGFAREDICQTVPKSLPSSERLLMLLERCFQYSLSVVKEEISSNESFDLGTFHQNGTECWGKIRAIIEEKNLIQSAVTENVFHNESVLSSDNIESLKKANSVYIAEDDKWKNTVSSFRKSLENKINSVYEVDVSKVEDKYQCYDYSYIKKCVSSSDEKLSQHINQLSSYKKTIRKCLKVNETLYNAANQRCHKYFKQNIQDTPRTSMKRMASRRFIKHYSRSLSSE